MVEQNLTLTAWCCVAIAIAMALIYHLLVRFLVVHELYEISLVIKKKDRRGDWDRWEMPPEGIALDPAVVESCRKNHGLAYLVNDVSGKLRRRVQQR